MIPNKFATPNEIESNNYVGDTWRGFTVRGTAGGDDPTDILPDVVSARLQFRTLDRRFVYELNTETLSVDGLPSGWPNNTTGVITLTPPELTAAGSFVAGRIYEILTAGTTDYTLIGSADNVVGTTFTATGVGVGTGTAYDTNYWVIAVDSQPLPMGAGTYFWELEATDILGTVRSLVNGKITLCQDITK
jgi:hypothetical protein